MRVIMKTSVFGPRICVDLLFSGSAVPQGGISRAGCKRTPPDLDSWVYSTPWFTTGADSLDSDMHSFLRTHRDIRNILGRRMRDLKMAVLTLCPIKELEDEDGSFACLIERRTLRRLSAIGLALEIAPARVMPIAPPWRNYASEC
jgi:hypothetical protein